MRTAQCWPFQRECVAYNDGHEGTNKNIKLSLGEYKNKELPSLALQAD